MAAKPSHDRRSSREARRGQRIRAGWAVAAALLVTTAGAILLGSLQSVHADPSGKVRIFFYDPDGNMKRIRNAKGAFNSYLGTVDSRLVFEPFAKWSTFRSNTQSQQPSFVIISSLYYQRTNRLFTLTPLLVSMRNGRHTYRKVVVAQRPEITDITHLHGRSFASTSREGLQLLAQSRVDISKLRVISVPKDMDALLALTFHRVDGALVSNRTIQTLARLSPGAVKKLRTLYQTSPIIMPRLCARGTVSADLINLVKKAFRKMSGNRQGRLAMRYLGIDDWVAVSGG